MVSATHALVQQNPYQCIIDAPVNKIMDTITDYFKNHLINYTFDLEDDELMTAILTQDGDIMKAYLENIVSIYVNDTGKVQYDLYLLQGVNEDENPLYNIPVNILQEIIEHINVTSYTILKNGNMNPPQGYQHQSENMEQMFIEYVGSLYYWYGYAWLRNMDISNHVFAQPNDLNGYDSE
jgi:hypothetical protein